MKIKSDFYNNNQKNLKSALKINQNYKKQPLRIQDLVQN